MFRIQDNVPETYVNQSRDFQLFCRLYDYVNNAVRFDIDTMTNVLNPMAARNNILKLLAAKVGFFPNHELDDTMMRYIIMTFPDVIKLKGTRAGINKCIDTILRARNIVSEYSVNIDNTEYTIDISIKTDFDRIALEEYLRYIIPPGYITTMSIAQGKEVAVALDQVNIIHTYVDPNSAVSQVVNSDYLFDNTGYSKFMLPSYNIEIEKYNNRPVVYTVAGSPTINVFTKGESQSENDLLDYFNGNNDAVDEWKIKYNWDKLADTSTITIWDYYEKDNGFIHHKTLTLALPYNDVKRQIGSINSSEIIGSYNDATYRSGFTWAEDRTNSDLIDREAEYIESVDNNGIIHRQKWGSDAENANISNTIDSLTGKDKSDIVGALEPITITKDNKSGGNPVQSIINLHLTRVFNDLLEQENNKQLILRVIDSTYLYIFDNQETEDVDEGHAFIQNESINMAEYLATVGDEAKKLVGLIRLDLLDIPEGIDLTKSREVSPYLIDNYMNIASLLAITEPDSTGKSYAVYIINSIGTPPTLAQEEVIENENNEENNNG